MVTGAAPISSSVLTFLRAALGCPVSLSPWKIAYFTSAQIRLIVQITVKTQLKSAKEKVTQSLKFKKKHPPGRLLCICVWKPFHKWHQCSKILVKQCPFTNVPCQIKICIILMVLEVTSLLLIDTELLTIFSPIIFHEVIRIPFMCMQLSIWDKSLQVGKVESKYTFLVCFFPH